MSEGGEDFAPEWTEVADSFDDMGLHENLLRGIYAYGMLVVMHFLLAGNGG